MDEAVFAPTVTVLGNQHVDELDCLECTLVKY